MKLGVIDYGAGNLRSVCNSFKAAGFEGVIVRSEEDMEGLTHLVLPGVGAFGDCMEKIHEQELAVPLRSWINQDKPFLGICIGYQVLFESSEETPGVEGLGIYKGHVERFPEMGIKVPHMGWNSVQLCDKKDAMWRGMGDDPYFYYVHSYYPCPEDPELIAATTSYGIPFAAAIRRGRLVATQFHPEKSQRLGLLLLKNFMNL